MRLFFFHFNLFSDLQKDSLFFDLYSEIRVSGIDNVFINLPWAGNLSGAGHEEITIYSEKDG